jgi:hypothetical protein
MEVSEANQEAEARWLLRRKASLNSSLVELNDDLN